MAQKDWPGGFITKTAPTVSTSSASGVWTLDQVDYYIQQGQWPSQQYLWAQQMLPPFNANSDYPSVTVDTAGNFYYAVAFPSASGQVQKTFLWTSTPQGTQSSLSFYGSTSTSSPAVYVRAMTFSAGYVYTVGQESSTYKVVLRKHDTSGNLSWSYSYTNMGPIDAAWVASDGNVLIGGNYSPSNVKFSLYKINVSTGAVMQGVTVQNFLVSTNPCITEQINTDSSGNVYTGGILDGSSGSVPYFVKYNSSFAIQWQKTFPAGASQDTGGIAVDSSGNVYCTAGVSIAGAGYIVRFAKFDSSGTLQWQRQISASSGYLTANRVYVGTDGFIYVSGFNYSTQSIMWVAKYNSSGTIQWQRTITVSGYIWRDAVLDANNNMNIILWGSGTTPNSTIQVKISSSGGPIGSYTVNGRSVVVEAATGTEAAGSITISNGTGSASSYTPSSEATTGMANAALPSVTYNTTSF